MALTTVYHIPSELWLNNLFRWCSACDLESLEHVSRFFRRLVSEFLPHQHRIYSHPLLHISIRNSFHVPALRNHHHYAIPYNVIMEALPVLERQFTSHHLAHPGLPLFPSFLRQERHPNPVDVDRILSQIALGAFESLPDTTPVLPLLTFSARTGCSVLFRRVMNRWPDFPLGEHIDVLLQEAAQYHHLELCSELLHPSTASHATPATLLQVLQILPPSHQGVAYTLGCQVLSADLFKNIEGKIIAATLPAGSPLSMYFLDEIGHPNLSEETLAQKLTCTAYHGDAVRFLALCSHPRALSLSPSLWNSVLTTMVERGHHACITCFFQHPAQVKTLKEISPVLRTAFDLRQNATLRLLLQHVPDQVTMHQAQQLMVYGAMNNDVELAHLAMNTRAFSRLSLENLRASWASLPESKVLPLKHKACPLVLQDAVYSGNLIRVRAILNSPDLPHDSDRYKCMLIYAYKNHLTQIAEALMTSSHFGRLEIDAVYGLVQYAIYHNTPTLLERLNSDHCPNGQQYFSDAAKITLWIRRAVNGPCKHMLKEWLRHSSTHCLTKALQCLKISSTRK